MTSANDAIEFEAPPGSGPARGKGPIVLVADDDYFERLLFRKALEAAGFDVVEAEDGVAAIAAFERWRPAIMVLDIVMPVMDGFTACEILRKTKAGRRAPIVLATSLGDMASIERAYDVGATDFISKPINWTIFVQRLRYMLRADETLRRLGESERRLAEAQRIASLGSFVWRVGAETLEGSNELWRIFGVVRGGNRVRLRTALRRIPTAERRKLIKSVRAALKAVTPLQQDFTVAPNGNYVRSVDLRGEVVVDATGRMTIQGSIQDITERKRAEAALIAARRAAESADAMKTALLAGMNHELRTPLNAVIGFSEIIAHEILGPIGENRYKEFAADILQAGRHMLDLVMNVLDMAKLASDSYPVNLEPADLRKLANTAVTIVGASDLAKNREIVMADWQFPTLASVDVRAVTQMLIHLLSNALKFSAPDTPVTVSCRRESSGELRLSVTDRGIGMTAEESEIAVEPFRQVDSRLARKYEGLGIGLSLVKRLIEQHGGQIAIDSKPGEGSRVTLVFPKALVLSEAISAAS